jgi:peptidoglycan/LPS O-acetylase OafA/YrhL
MHSKTDAIRSQTVRADIPGLTGFRFLSAFLVLLGHSYSVVSFGDTNIIGVWLGPLASCGMTMFFVLSGFLMWLNYGELYRDQNPLTVTRTFAVARIARLYPMLLCTLLLAVSIIPWSALIAAMPGALLYPLMMNAWLPGNGAVPITLTVWNAAHTWSISVEVFCYVLFPVFALSFCWVRSRPAILVCGLLLLVALLFVAFIVPRHAPRMQLIFGTSMPIDQLVMWITYYSPVTRILEFGLGCVAASYFTYNGRSNARSSAPIIAGAIALSGAIFMFANPTIVNSWSVHDLIIRGCLAAGSTLTVYGLARTPNHFISRILSTKAILMGGEISYSTYLLHPFLLSPFIHQPFAQITTIGVCEWIFTMAGALTAIYFVSYATYHAIETPSRRWIRRYFAAQPDLTVRTLNTVAQQP